MENILLGFLAIFFLFIILVIHRIINFQHKMEIEHKKKASKETHT